MKCGKYLAAGGAFMACLLGAPAPTDYVQDIEITTLRNKAAYKQAGEKYNNVAGDSIGYSNRMERNRREIQKILSELQRAGRK